MNEIQMKRLEAHATPEERDVLRKLQARANGVQLPGALEEPENVVAERCTLDRPLEDFGLLVLRPVDGRLNAPVLVAGVETRLSSPVTWITREQWTAWREAFRAVLDQCWRNFALGTLSATVPAHVRRGKTLDELLAMLEPQREAFNREHDPAPAPPLWGGDRWDAVKVARLAGAKLGTSAYDRPVDPAFLASLDPLWLVRAWQVEQDRASLEQDELPIPLKTPRFIQKTTTDQNAKPVPGELEEQDLTRLATDLRHALYGATKRPGDPRCLTALGGSSRDAFTWWREVDRREAERKTRARQAADDAAAAAKTKPQKEGGA